MWLAVVTITRFGTSMQERYLWREIDSAWCEATEGAVT